MARYVILMPIGPICSTGPIGAICPNELMPIGPFGSTDLIGAICTMYANWANWFHGPNWRDMYYVCQMGQLVPSAQLARYVLFMPNEPIGSTGPIGAIYLNELLPIGQIGSIGPIGAICPIVANWANWFHGPIWRDKYYVCQLGQLLPRAQSVRFITMIWCHLGQLVPRAQWVRYVSKNYCQLCQLVPLAQLARYVLLMPIGPICSTGPIGAICTLFANWANWFQGPNWCDVSQ